MDEKLKSTKLLNGTDAALKLGITKELLFAYVKYATKGKKLNSCQNKNNHFFDIDSLKDWDSFLKKPWTSDSKNRIPIPKYIKDYLKVESTGKCARCGAGHRLDNAHIIPWAESLSHHHHNLIRLCTDCHTKYDDGVISKEEILQIKSELIAQIKSDLISELGVSQKPTLKVPNLCKGFVGRKKEIVSILDSIDRSILTIIQGVGGIGKTQTLIKALQNVEKECLWINTEDYSDLKDLQLFLLTTFNASSINELVEIFDKKDSVIIFDGLEDLLFKKWDETADFIDMFVKYTNTARFIVTTQVDFSDNILNSNFICIQGLENNSQKEYLKNTLSEIDLTDKFLIKLMNYSDGHPLSLRLIAGLILFYSDTEQVWKYVQEEGVKILNDPKRKEQTKSSSLAVCLSLVYSNLKEAHKILLKYLVNFPAGCKKYTLEILAGKKQTFSTEKNVMNSLAVLNQFNLLRFETDILRVRRVSLLNPIKSFVQDRAKVESLEKFHKIKIDAFRNLMIEALIINDRYMLSDQLEIALLRYEQELPNYIYAMRQAIHSGYCKECQKYSDKTDYLFIIKGISAALYKYFFTRGFVEQALFFSNEGAKAHIELGEYTEAIDDLVQLATIQIRNFDFEGAEETLLQMKKCAQKHKKSANSCQIKYIEGLIIRNKNPKKAIQLFQESINLLSNSNDKNFIQANTALLLSDIGRTYERELRSSDTALKFYLNSYTTYSEIQDFANMYSTAHHIGNCYASMQEIEKAVEYYREALEGFCKLGQLQYIGNSLSELGRLKIDHPALDYSHFLTKSTIVIGLQDIKNEIVTTLKTNPNSANTNLNGGIYDQQIYKLFLIIKLVSLTPHSHLLVNWSSTLLNIISRERDSLSIRSYPWLFLNIAKLACEVEQYPNNKDKLKELKNLCYLHGNEVEHDIYDPFKWLSLWLRKKINIHVTRGELFVEVEEM